MRPWTIVTLATLFWSTSAGAQPVESETPTTGVPMSEADKARSFQATQLYKAALADFEKNRFDKALEKFRQSYGVVKSPNTRLMIVRSLAGLERHAEAYREAVVLLAEAEAAAAQSDKYATAIESAQLELDALAPKLALVMVLVDAPEGATVALNGEPLPADAWGKPFPVEPGEIEVTLTSAKGTITERGEAAIGQQLELTLVPDAAPPPKPKPVAIAPADEPSDGYDGPDRKILALAAGGVGVIGLVNFGIFGMLSNGQLDRLEIRCEGSTCDPSLEEEADKGRTYQTVANASLTIGAVFLAGGAALLLWDLLDDEPAEAAVVIGPGSLGLRGSF